MSLRRNIRLRREYLYRKSLEGKERAVYERKRKIKEALSEGKAIPTELRNDATKLQADIELDDENTSLLRTHVDDEYANAGIYDPKIAVTTSRDPSSRLKQFSKEIKLIIPNSQQLNRGNTKIGELVEIARNSEFTDLVVLHETRGEPDALVITHLPYGPTAYFSLNNTVLRHDIENRATMSEAYPHIIMSQFSGALGQRVGNILKHLFPVPKDDSKRVITFHNMEDHISFRHHVYKKEGLDVQLHEVGPRFEMKLYQLKLGTMDQKTAENEWILRPYMNTAKKRKILSE